MHKVNRNEKKKSKRKQILVNALIIKVCKCGDLVGSSSKPLKETASENCVTKVLEAL
jgi:hypothetical protein